MSDGSGTDASAFRHMELSDGLHLLVLFVYDRYFTEPVLHWLNDGRLGRSDGIETAFNFARPFAADHMRTTSIRSRISQVISVT